MQTKRWRSHILKVLRASVASSCAYLITVDFNTILMTCLLFCMKDTPMSSWYLNQWPFGVAPQRSTSLRGITNNHTRRIPHLLSSKRPLKFCSGSTMCHDVYFETQSTGTSHNVRYTVVLGFLVVLRVCNSAPVTFWYDASLRTNYRDLDNTTRNSISSTSSLFL